MAYTTAEIVKKHLLSAGEPALAVENAVVVLTGTDAVSLRHHHLVDKSERVKWNTALAPESEGPVQLSGMDWASLSRTDLVPGRTVVAANESLATVYAEQADYQVDPAGGSIRRAAGGAITDPQSVYVYYYYYTLFEAEVDYVFDAEAGTLQRLGASRIPEGAEVWVDYTLSAGSASDALIEQALVEAHDRIVRALAAGYNGSSTDQGLATGETELVLAILARDLAANRLSQGAGADSASRSREWQRLADLYEVRAWQILRPFLDPYVLHGPEKRSND